MSGRQVIEYVIEEPPPQEPPRRPWWLAMGRVAVALLAVVVVAVVGFRVAESLAERASVELGTRREGQVVIVSGLAVSPVAVGVIGGNGAVVWCCAKDKCKTEDDP